MNFFCTKKHYDQWAVENSINHDEVFCLDAYEALVVAKMLFSIE
jgi:hypothetical protein